MRITMFKSRQPKQFNLKTRFYNPEDEEHRRRLKKEERAKEGYKLDVDELKEEMKYRWGLHRQSKSDFNKENTSISRVLLLVLISVVIIGIITYLNS